MRRLFALMLLVAAPVAAQTPSSPRVVDVNRSAPPSTLCVLQADGTCTLVSPINPLPTSGAGGASTPTGPAGTPNANVVTVQGVNGGTPQNVQGTGTAGTPATAVITTQGIAGGTPQPVSGAFFQATQPVSNAGAFAVQNTAATPAGTNSIGTVGLNAGSNAIGSITNTSFGVTQATAANLNATVVGTGTFATQVSSSALPTGGATSANQATQITAEQAIQANQTNGTEIVKSLGSANIVSGLVGINTTATLLVAARAGRQRVTVTVTAANQCYFGPSGVTPSTGFPLAPTAYVAAVFNTAAAVYAVCSVATNVAYLEEY